MSAGKLKPTHHPLCRWTPKDACTCGLDAVLAECADLRERVRLARAHALREFAGPGEVIALRLRRMYELLDLRRPLPKRATRKRAR